MINSCETEKFEVGKEYWTYFMQTSKKGNQLIDYTGIMKVRLDSKKPSQYTPNGYKLFTILESKKLGETIANNIHTYMEGYGFANCNFYDTKDECVAAHDADLIEKSQYLNTKDRNSFLKKLINSKSPEKSKIEVDSVNWYKNLSDVEKSYVSWIKHYYEEI